MRTRQDRMTGDVPSPREIFAQFMADPANRTLVGVRVGGDPADEAEHFYPCNACRQLVDMRDLAAVFHHEESNHEPLSAQEADRLVRISIQLRRTLRS